MPLLGDCYCWFRLDWFPLLISPKKFIFEWLNLQSVFIFNPSIIEQLSCEKKEYRIISPKVSRFCRYRCSKAFSIGQSVLIRSLWCLDWWFYQCNCHPVGTWVIRQCFFHFPLGPLSISLTFIPLISTLMTASW